MMSTSTLTLPLPKSGSVYTGPTLPGGASVTSHSVRARSRQAPPGALAALGYPSDRRNSVGSGHGPRPGGRLALPGGDRGVHSLVLHRRRLPGLPGVAALAVRVRLPGLRSRRLAAG